MLRLADHPQLQAIAWNRPCAEISEADAFALYELNRQWVDRSTMIPAEARLFADLVTRFGHGVFLGRSRPPSWFGGGSAVAFRCGNYRVK